MDDKELRKADLMLTNIAEFQFSCSFAPFTAFENKQSQTSNLRPSSITLLLTLAPNTPYLCVSLFYVDI